MEEDVNVLLRFSRSVTIMELLIAACLPLTLAIVSCLSLVIFSRVIYIDDDSKLTIQCCGDNEAEIVKEVPDAIAL
jgi:hypothetical protein